MPLVNNTQWVKQLIHFLAFPWVIYNCCEQWCILTWSWHIWRPSIAHARGIRATEWSCNISFNHFDCFFCFPCLCMYMWWRLEWGQPPSLNWIFGQSSLFNYFFFFFRFSLFLFPFILSVHLTMQWRLYGWLYVWKEENISIKVEVKKWMPFAPFINIDTNLENSWLWWNWLLYFDRKLIGNVFNSQKEYEGWLLDL